ncbi:GNAT family N-acetyltransferase [Flavobacteriaceae bacterium M23B6Z8]
MSKLQIVEVTEVELDELAPLFNQYRIFYEQRSDLRACKEFLLDRIRKSESTLFLARNSQKEACGFVQLYPVFSSVSLEGFYILNDLFVAPKERKKGTGEALLKRAIRFSMDENSKGLALETAVSNPAQKLYERLGWKKDTEFLHYFRPNKPL